MQMTMTKLGRAGLAALACAALVLGSAGSAQVRSVDPDRAIDSDLVRPQPAPPQPASPPPAPGVTETPVAPMAGEPGVPAPAAPTGTVSTTAPLPPSSTTYHQDDLIGAAEGVFGKGAQGLAGVIQDLLKKQGEPNGYIVGREGGAALVVGVRYGSGTLFHKVEGQRPVYWTGPSIGFDAGANAGNTFILVYNLYNSEDLYKRFPAGEGQAYLIGGFNVSYMRRGDIVLIPVRAGVGLRLGVNAGYMKFSHHQRWLPF